MSVASLQKRIEVVINLLQVVAIGPLAVTWCQWG